MDMNPAEETAPELSLKALESAEPEEIAPEAAPEIDPKDLAFLLENDAWGELSFGGKDGGPVSLAAFSPRRQAAAQALGMRFLNFGPEEVEELQASGTYPGILHDATVALFLCTQPKSVAQRAFRTPSVVQNEALAWMDRNRISIGSPRHAEMLERFGELANAVIGASAEIDRTGLGEGASLGE